MNPFLVGFGVGFNGDGEGDDDMFVIKDEGKDKICCTLLKLMEDMLYTCGTVHIYTSII